MREKKKKRGEKTPAISSFPYLLEEKGRRGKKKKKRSKDIYLFSCQAGERREAKKTSCILLRGRRKKKEKAVCPLLGLGATRKKGRAGGLTSRPILAYRR